ncbi:MAG: hypothetical protein WBE45_14625 [Terriglobales bacterium]
MRPRHSTPAEVQPGPAEAPRTIVDLAARKPIAVAQAARTAGQQARIIADLVAPRTQTGVVRRTPTEAVQQPAIVVAQQPAIVVVLLAIVVAQRLATAVVRPAIEVAQTLATVVVPARIHQQEAEMFL